MNKRLKTLALGAIVVGSLVVSSGAAMARDYYQRDYNRWSRQDSRWGNSYDRRQEYQQLEQLRAKVEYDARHGASRKKLAQQQAQIQALEERLGINRGYGWYR